MSITLSANAFERDRSGRFTFRDMVNNITAYFFGANAVAKSVNRSMIQTVQGFSYTEDGVVKYDSVQVHVVTAAKTATSAAHQAGIDAATNQAWTSLRLLAAATGGNASLANTNERLIAGLEVVADGSTLS